MRGQVTSQLMVYRSILCLSLAFSATVTAASPISLILDGAWETWESSPNITIAATFDSASPDMDPWARVGSYKISSVSFNFAYLGKISSPFQLLADVQQSTLHLYPTTNGSPTGEVRIFGRFDSAASLPNGILATEFDLRMVFGWLEDDKLSSLGRLGALKNTSLYFSDQIGARSSDFAQSEVRVVQSAVPEPSTLALLLASIGALALTRTKRKTITNQVVGSAG